MPFRSKTKNILIRVFVVMVALGAISSVCGYVLLENDLKSPIAGTATGIGSPEQYRDAEALRLRQRQLGIERGTLFPEDAFGSGFGIGSSSGPGAVLPQRPLVIQLTDATSCSVALHACDGACTAFGGALVYSTPRGDFVLRTRHVGPHSSDYWLDSIDEDVRAFLAADLISDLPNRERLLELQETIHLSHAEDLRQEAAKEFAINCFQLWHHQHVPSSMMAPGNS